MSQSDETEPTIQGIDDEQLPDDLQPDDNPLAAGLDDGETVDDLMTGGKPAEQTQESDGSQDDDSGAS
jgi:hypothetical protein